jgi:predicted ferric reductase
LIYGNFGRGGTTAEVEALPGEAVRVTVKMARPWQFKTGAHAYLYMPGIGWWTSHPFSIAWSDEVEGVTQNRLAIDPEKGFDMGASSEVLGTGEQTMSFIIRARTGFTEKLWRKAERTANGRFTSKCFVEGPYGHQTLHSYGTVLLFAAGVGITHQVPHVRDLVTGYSNGTVAARKVVLIWIIQSPEHLEWIRPWMTAILSLPRRREVLKILLFVTRPRSTKEIHSPSSSVQMFPGKPNIQALVDQEVETAIGAIGVSVCGVGALADDVRKSCRSWMTKVNLDFSEESFSW